MKVIEAKTIAEAWLGGSSYLRGCLIGQICSIGVPEPTLVRKQDREVANILDSFLRPWSIQQPYRSRKQSSLAMSIATEVCKGVYENIQTRYIQSSKSIPHRWGTYAYRLVTSAVQQEERCTTPQDLHQKCAIKPASHPFTR